MPLPFAISDCWRKQFVTFHYAYSCNTAAISRGDAIHLLTRPCCPARSARRGTMNCRKIQYQHLVTSVLFSLLKGNIWIRKSSVYVSRRLMQPNNEMAHATSSTSADVATAYTFLHAECLRGPRPFVYSQLHTPALVDSMTKRERKEEKQGAQQTSGQREKQQVGRRQRLRQRQRQTAGGREAVRVHSHCSECG